jgi:hypothetical protein
VQAVGTADQYQAEAIIAEGHIDCAALARSPLDDSRRA